MTLRKRIRFLLRRARYTFAPIFLVGAPRSGTTWLNSILGRHPLMATGPEPYAIEAIAALVEKVEERAEGGQGVLNYTDRWELDRCLQDLFHRMFAEYVFPAPYFVCTTPYNTDFMGEIERVFPRAPVIHLIRDGRDVALSLVRANRERGYAYFPDSIEGGAARWKRIERVLEFGAAHPHRYVEVRYERLLEDLTGELERLFERLDIPLHAETLKDMHRASGRRFHPSADTETSGFAGKWRSGFSADDAAAFKREAGDLLIRLGYEDDDGWDVR